MELELERAKNRPEEWDDLTGSEKELKPEIDYLLRQGSPGFQMLAKAKESSKRGWLIIVQGERSKNRGETPGKRTSFRSLRSKGGLL